MATSNKNIAKAEAAWRGMQDAMADIEGKMDDLMEMFFDLARDSRDATARLKYATRFVAADELWDTINIFIGSREKQSRRYRSRISDALDELDDLDRH